MILALLFEETRKISITRSTSLSNPLAEHIESGMIDLRQIDPGEMAPGQLIHLSTTAVEENDVKVIVIDSLNGYLQAMPDVKFLNLQLHELLTFLSHRGIVTFLTVAQHGILGSNMVSPIDLTYPHCQHSFTFGVGELAKGDL